MRGCAITGAVADRLRPRESPDRDPLALRLAVRSLRIPEKSGFARRSHCVPLRPGILPLLRKRAVGVRSAIWRLFNHLEPDQRVCKRSVQPSYVARRSVRRHSRRHGDAADLARLWSVDGPRATCGDVLRNCGRVFRGGVRRHAFANLRSNRANGVDHNSHIV